MLEVDVGAEEVNGFLTGILGGILGLVVDGLDVVVDVLVLDELATGESESSRAGSLSFFDWACCCCCSLNLARSFMASIRCL